MIRASKQCSLFFVLSLFFSCSRQIAISPNDYYHNDGTATFSAHSDDPSASVLYFTESCIIFARSSKPYAAVISPGFNPQATPADVLASLYQVQSLSIESSKAGERSARFNIPEWINNFVRLEVLKLDDIEIGDMHNRQRLRIKHLIVGNLRSANQLDVCELVDLSQLRYLVYSNLESIKGLSIIQSKAPEIVIIRQKKYNKLVDHGKIIVMN